MSVISDYSRIVSFNNVTDEPYEAQSAINFNDINFGYGASVINNISDYYSNNNLSVRDYSLKRRKLSAQSGSCPKKLILKNKLSAQQLEYNMNHCRETINYHENLDDLINNYNDKSYSLYGEKLKSGAEAKPRRKSYSDMTFEELNELDPQYQNTKSKIDQFKFDSQKTYYLPQRKSVAVPKIEVTKSRPNLNYKSINLNYKHEKFRLNRTLLLFVDGRKHTWNSLYYLINSNFLQDYDNLVISSLLPSSVSDAQLIMNRCERLIKWFLSLLKTQLILRVTVDYVINEEANLDYKKFIKNIFGQYNPNLLLFSNKSSNLNFKYPVKISKQTHSRFLIKFSSYLIKYSSIPVILVNGYRNDRKGSIQSIQSEQSSISSNDKIGDEYNEDNEMNYEPQQFYPKKGVYIDLSDVNYNTFADVICKISDKSLEDSKEYLKMMDDEPPASKPGSVTFNKVSFKNRDMAKVDSIYNSNLSKIKSNNEDMFKVKSLLEADNVSVSKSVKSESSGNSGLTTKMIKKSLKKEEPKKPEKKKGFWKKVFS